MMAGASVRGAVALHGGGEFLAGDEPFLDAIILDAVARRPPAERQLPLHVQVVPTAAAQVRPKLAAKNGIAAFQRASLRLGREIVAEPCLIVDQASADDPGLAEAVGAAHLIHFPGGNPSQLPAVLDGTRCWQAMLAAYRRGAVIAGASAGAMGLAGRTWTPAGWRDGLNLVAGLIVVPHFGMFDLSGWEETIRELDAAGLGRLGLDERTGVLSDGDDRHWHVVGEGSAHWFPVGGDPVVVASGGTLTFSD
jgi:cyanophycinase